MQRTRDQDLIDRAQPLYADQGIRFDNDHTAYNMWTPHEVASTRLQYRRSMQKANGPDLPDYPNWVHKPEQEKAPVFSELGNTYYFGKPPSPSNPSSHSDHSSHGSRDRQPPPMPPQPP